MRFLYFKGSGDRNKVYPGPGLDSIPPDGGALPEEDRWSGPSNNLQGGDAGTGPGHYVKDVPDLQKGTGTASKSRFLSVTNYIPPRAIPR